jgi:photosystem II stability/assembly factor-like uncharacterized protein
LNATGLKIFSTFMKQFFLNSSNLLPPSKECYFSKNKQVNIWKFYLCRANYLTLKFYIKYSFKKRGELMRFKNVILFTIVLFLFIACSEGSTGPDDEGKVGWAIGDPESGYATILHTVDGGQNWIRQGDSLSVPNVSLHAVQALNKHNVWIVGPQADGYAAVLRTVNGGEDWQRLPNDRGALDEELLGLRAISEDEIWAVGANNTIIHTTDGGMSWEDKSDPNLPNYQLASIAVVGNKVWVCGNISTGGGILIYSDDYGETWTQQGDSDFLADHGLIQISAASEDEIWAVGHQRSIIHTSNGGQDWQVQKTDAESGYDANGVCAVNEDVVWVVEDLGYIFYTANSGQDWQQQQTPAAASSYFLYRVSPLDANTAWVVAPSSTFPLTGIILYTEDAGQTWIPQDFQPNVSMWDVSFVGANH